MTTRVFQIARVLLGSTVDRIDAIDADGHALRLEVPTGEAQTATEGRVLVLQWSMHDLPVARALHQEWQRGKQRIGDGLEGAARFAGGERATCAERRSSR